MPRITPLVPPLDGLIGSDGPVHPFSSTCPAHPGDEDAIDDLPPMDGDESDEQAVEPIEEAHLAHFDQVDGKEDDGRTVTELPVGELIELLPATPDTSTDSDTEQLELATSEEEVAYFDQKERAGKDDDEEGVPGDDASLGIDVLVELGADDEREGTDEPLEREVDESAFPTLDADETGELEESLDIGEIDLPEEVGMPAWSDAPWTRLDTPLIAVPMRFVACTREHVAAAGDGAVLVTASSDSPASYEFAPIPASDGVEFIGVGLPDLQDGGMLLASRQRVFAATKAERPRPIAELPSDDPADGLRHVELGIGLAFAYATTLRGRLLVSADQGRTWRTMAGVGTVMGLATDELGAAHVLAKQSGELRWLRSDERGQWESKPIEGVEMAGSKGACARMAVLGSTWVVGLETGELMASSDSGETWSQVRLPAALRCASIVPGDRKNVVVAVVYSESEDRSFLISWCPGREPRLVADLSPDVAVGGADVDTSEGMGRAHHCLWDPFRGCLWVAGAFGLCAWRPALPT